MFSGGALDLHPAVVGVAGLLVTMVFTWSSTWEISTLELLRFSLEAAVESLNCLRAASSCETGLVWAVVAEDGGFLVEGSGGLLLLIIGVEGDVPGSSLPSLHKALISMSSSSDVEEQCSISFCSFISLFDSVSSLVLSSSISVVAALISCFVLDPNENIYILSKIFHFFSFSSVLVSSFYRLFAFVISDFCLLDFSLIFCSDM